MPDAAVEFRDGAPQISFELQFAHSCVEILAGRLQHEEVRSTAVFVVPPGERLRFMQHRQNFGPQGLQIFAGLQVLGAGSSDFERDPVPHGDELAIRLLKLSVGDRDAASISVEDRQRESQAGS